MKRRGSRYRDDWGSDVKPEDLAVRVHPKNGSLGVVKGAGHVDPRAKPIKTIADVERVLQIPRLHITRAKHEKQRELEGRQRSETLEARRVRKALGVRARVTLGDDQPKNAVTIHQLLELPNAAIGGRRIDHKALRKDWLRAVGRAGAQQSRADARKKARDEDARWASVFGMSPAGEAYKSAPQSLLALFLMALDVVVKRINRKKKR